MLYALPTALYVAVFFVVPLLLVVRMSAGNWTLLGGDRGLNFPKNFTAIGSNTLFWPAVAFTIEYTVIVTILLIGLGLGLALLVQESGRWSGFLRTSFLLPAAIGLATASLLESDLTTTPIRIERGSMRVPDAAGLGVSLDPEALERYTNGWHEVTR